MFLIAQVISCGFCCDYFPEWMCLAFRVRVDLLVRFGGIAVLLWAAVLYLQQAREESR